MKLLLCTALLVLSGMASSTHAAASYQTWNIYYMDCCDDEGEEYPVLVDGQPKIRFVVRLWDFPINPTLFAACVPSGVAIVRYIEQVGETVSRAVQFYGQDEEIGTFLITSVVLNGNADEACLQNFVNAHLGPGEPQPTSGNVPPSQLPGGDFDGDGKTNANDTDDDNDGVPDATDPSPFNPAVPPHGTGPAGDYDGDGIPNSNDSDDDNDGTPDATDPAPTNPNIPTSGGGTGDPGGGTGDPGGGTGGGGGDPGGGTGDPGGGGGEGSGDEPWTGPKNQGLPGGAGNKNPNIAPLPGFGQTFGLAIGSWASFSPTTQQAVTLHFEFPWVDGNPRTFSFTSIPSGDTPMGSALNDLRMLVRTALAVFMVWTFLSRIYRDLVMY